ncbi:hypothetical protein [Streptomyces adelaidensis]|uniref:hypothetical protein n=1 Tax=Streptomyces adelaidensis TaxID=2796465 RepID=UPI0019041303|nr:hypothetical protein [Streptomyces adelaidensis]
MPAHRRRARAGSPWPRPLTALVHGCLLITIVLCTFVHGPGDETHRSPAPAVPAAVSLAGAEAPHGPHGHHTAEECHPGGVLRAPGARTPDLPPAAEATPLLAGVAAIALGPVRAERRRPHRRRRARAARTALIRTSRWRI